MKSLAIDFAVFQGYRGELHQPFHFTHDSQVIEFMSLVFIDFSIICVYRIKENIMCKTVCCLFTYLGKFEWVLANWVFNFIIIVCLT